MKDPNSLADIIALIINIVIWGTAILVFYKILYKPRPNGVHSRARFGQGREYDYTVGDNLRSYRSFGLFNGLDVALPISMPHIYLDSKKAGGRQVHAMFDASQRISLEGDFNKYFAVFVPTKYTTVALSVLTPDVMETLKNHAANFDIEIYGDHLRIICNRSVNRNETMQAEMLTVAEKILKEIEDRQRSWTAENTLQSINQDLIIYPESGFRRFGRYYSWTRLRIGLFWSMCIAPFVLISAVYMSMRHYGKAVLFLTLSMLILITLQRITAKLQAEASFRSRSG